MEPLRCAEQQASTCQKSHEVYGRHQERSRVDHRCWLQTTILRVTRERWAQIGISIQFLIIVRTLAEMFRLKHVPGPNFLAATVMPYVVGALIATCFCWASVVSYFFRRFALSSWIALAAVVVLLVYKVAVIGW
jgi:hypothetical protein